MDEIYKSAESTTATGGVSEDKAEPSGRRVLPIGAEVRSFLALYLSLFDNYSTAASEVGIAKDTLARYFEGSPNIALYVFDRMAEIVNDRASPEAITRYLRENSIDELRGLAYVRNSRELDRSRYEMTPGLVRILEHFTERFANRAQAAAAIDMNPRTLKAYLAGNIQSFPVRHFSRIIEYLEDQSLTLPEILEIAGAEDWNEVLPLQGRTDGQAVSRDDALQALRFRLESEDHYTKRLSKPVYLALRRHFESLEDALDHCMEQIAEEMTREGQNLREGAMKLDDCLNRYTRWRKNLNARFGATRREKQRLESLRSQVRSLRERAGIPETARV